MSRGGPQRPQPIAGVEDLAVKIKRLEKEQSTLVEMLHKASSGDRARLAKKLYSDGWSNRRIAEALDITLTEARRLTK